MQISQTDVDKFKKMFFFRIYFFDSFCWLTSLNDKKTRLWRQKCFLTNINLSIFLSTNFSKICLACASPCKSASREYCLVLAFCFQIIFTYLLISSKWETFFFLFFSHFFFSLSFVMKQQYIVWPRFCKLIHNTIF